MRPGQRACSSHFLHLSPSRKGVHLALRLVRNLYSLSRRKRPDFDGIRVRSAGDGQFSLRLAP